MNTHTTLAAVLAMAALSAPMVCQAQDPATMYQQIQKLSQNGQAEEAIKLCDKVISVYGNPSSRVAKQFMYMVPFFYYQKGSIQFGRKDYAGAYETFDALGKAEAYKDPKLIEASKAIPGQPQGYAPFLTMCQFQKGYCLFQMAVGDGKTPGDASKFDEAISTLEAYLDLYKTNKVSQQEKKLKLDGTICFLLMQAYILKQTPDFKKAGEYLEKSRTARAPLSDEMAMNGLNSVVKVTTKNPEYIDWCDKVISSNPESFDLSTARMAPYGANMLNYGTTSVRIGDDFLRAGKLDAAAGAMRSAVAFFGLVPDSTAVIETMNGMTRLIGKSKQAVPDRATGQTLNPALYAKLKENYDKFVKSNMQPEAFSTLYQANIALLLGSNRLAKAGYKVILDRYPDLAQQKEGGKLEPMKNTNYFQYANLCRSTGDEATAEKFEKMVDAKVLGNAGKNSLIVNKMARLARDKKWEEVIPAAEAVMKALEADKNDPNYITAEFTRIAAMYKLKQYKETAKAADALLASGELGSEKLKPKQAFTYETQARFFALHCYNILSAEDAKLLDKAIDGATEFMKKFPSVEKDNPLSPNVYYFCVDSLLKRRGHGDEAAMAKDLERALKYCDFIAEHWPENGLAPTALLIGGKILVNGEDDEKKPEGLDRLEKAVDVAFDSNHGTESDKASASEALFMLVSYSGEFEREDRVAGYVERFWKDADYEGNPFALQMVAINLMNAADGKDKDAYDAAVKRAQEVIAREANYGFANNKPDPELEKTINAYASAYVDGTKKFAGKDLTLEEKTEHFTNFPGINKENKYATAILRMSMIRSMADAQTKARKDNPELAAKLENDISRTMRQMTNDFKPEDLTNFICVQVGNSTTDYAAKMPDPNTREAQINTALTYFDQVISRNGDRLDEARLGKANALALSSDKAKQTESGELYKALADSRNVEVAGPALMGVTKLYLATGDANAAVEAASKYVNTPALGRGKGRLDMLMMLGEAYGKAGNIKEALQTYMNLYNQNIGTISYSAPACKAIMQLMWERNTPATGDRMKGNFKQSDRWRAWTTGQDYITKIRKNGIDKKMSAADRDLFLEVEKLVDDYSKDAGVQQEDKAKKAFQSKIGK